jgi:hypothetical protein
LVELAHLYCIVQNSTRTIDQRLVLTTCYSNHFQIEPRAEPGVETQLFMTIIFAFGKRGKVEEPEVDRLLDLVCKLSSQKHPRNMGFEQGDVGRRVWIAVRRHKRLKQLFSHCHSSSPTILHVLPKFATVVSHASAAI